MLVWDEWNTISWLPVSAEGLGSRSFSVVPSPVHTWLVWSVEGRSP